MKASEARKLTEEKALTLQDLLSGIGNSAKMGQNTHFTPFGVEVSDDIVKELLRLGYSIKQHTDQFNGFKSVIVSW